jgi:hypothetical protein
VRYKIYIGIDNGVTGTIAILCPSEPSTFMKMPVISEQSYTKTKQNITRLNFPELNAILHQLSCAQNPVFCIIERPMVNPGRWKATLSAIRCLESTLISLQLNKIPYQYMDSKEWQKEMLPKGITKNELKPASLDIASRIFPHLKMEIQKHKDGDSLLMAEYARRKGL